MEHFRYIDVCWTDNHPANDEPVEPGHYALEYATALTSDDPRPVRLRFRSRRAYEDCRRADGGIEIVFLDGVAIIDGDAAADTNGRIILTNPTVRPPIEWVRQIIADVKTKSASRVAAAHIDHSPE